ncbi:MAG: hypothetical protein ABGY11_01100 [Candidatus Thioglobus sp.]
MTLGVLGGAALIYFKYGGLSGIGQALGGAVSGFGSGITQGLNRFGNLVTTPESNAPNTSARIVEQEQLGEYVINVPKEESTLSLSAQQKGGLTFAGFLEAHNLGGTINLRTNEFVNQYGVQPLDFTINGSGGINTGRIGLSDATLKAQTELSAKYGIPTFDTVGNLSTFGGIATGNPYGNYSNPNYPVTS